MRAICSASVNFFFLLNMNFCAVIPDVKRVKCILPSSISSLATFALLLDVAGRGAITTHFVSPSTQEGVTAMPRGLHARFCYAL